MNILGLNGVHVCVVKRLLGLGQLDSRGWDSICMQTVCGEVTLDAGVDGLSEGSPP